MLRPSVQGVHVNDQPADVSDNEASLWGRAETVLHSLMRRNTAWVFNEPVDPVKAGAPDYLDVIQCVLLRFYAMHLDIVLFSFDLSFLEYS